MGKSKKSEAEKISAGREILRKAIAEAYAEDSAPLPGHRWFCLGAESFDKNPRRCVICEHRETCNPEVSSIEDIPIEIDVTGTVLCPENPTLCLGSDHYPAFVLCCDECDHYLDCYPATYTLDEVLSELGLSHEDLDAQDSENSENS